MTALFSGKVGLTLVGMSMLSVLAGLPGSAQGAETSTGGASAAYQKAASAKVQYLRAREKFNRIHLQLDREFYDSLEYVSARADITAARAELAAARKPALEAARATAEYQALLRSEQNAELQLENLYSNKDTEPHQIVSLARELLKIRIAMSKAERAAMTDNPDIETAKANLVIAHNMLLGLREQHQRNRLGDPHWSHARDTMFAARTKLSGANIQVDRAVHREWDRKNGQLAAMIRQ